MIVLRRRSNTVTSLSLRPSARSGSPSITSLAFGTTRRGFGGPFALCPSLASSRLTRSLILLTSFAARARASWRGWFGPRGTGIETACRRFRLSRRPRRRGGEKKTCSKSGLTTAQWKATVAWLQWRTFGDHTLHGPSKSMCRSGSGSVGVRSAIALRPASGPRRGPQSQGDVSVFTKVSACSTAGPLRNYVVTPRFRNFSMCARTWGTFPKGGSLRSYVVSRLPGRARPCHLSRSLHLACFAGVNHERTCT